MIGIVIFTVSIVLMIIYLVWFCFGQQKISKAMSIIVNAIMIMLSIVAFSGGIIVYSRYSIQNDIEPESQTEVQTDVLESSEDEPEGELEYVPDELEIEKGLQESTTDVSESGIESLQAEPSTSSEGQEDEEDQTDTTQVQTGESGGISTESEEMSIESEEMSTELEDESIESEEMSTESESTLTETGDVKMQQTLIERVSRIAC